MSRHIAQGLIVTLAVLLGACARSEGGGTAAPPQTGLPSAASISAVPMGHVAGLTDSVALARSIRNPYAGNPQAVAQGKQLYVDMNCVTCHAADGKGNMGPPLDDTYWRYGGFPVEIYKSIHDGRAQGMPAWGAALPPQEIWKLVAYIQSFGGSFAANGVARGVQRNDVIATEAARHADDSSAHAPRAGSDSSALPFIAVPRAAVAPSPAVPASPPSTPKPPTSPPSTLPPSAGPTSP